MLFMQILIRFGKELFCIENDHLFAVMLVQNEEIMQLSAGLKKNPALVNLKIYSLVGNIKMIW